MKQTLLTTAALTGLALAAAPAAHAQGIRFGVKAGANYSNLAGDLTDQDRYQSKFGPHGGLMMNIGLLDDGFLSLQPELLFSQKGFKYADTEFTLLGNTYRYTGKRNYNYLDVPVLLKINADGPFFEAGPQFGYLLSVSDDVKRLVNGQTQNSSTDYKTLDNVNRAEIGYAAGVGYQAKSGPMLGLRYNGSFTKWGKGNASSDEFSNARNSVFQLYLGYMFGGK
jgi:hypothetical protein